MIYLTGDTHGEHNRFYHKMLRPDGPLTAKDFLIVAGDWGYLFKNNKTEEAFLNDLDESLPYTMLFVDGNHENFPAIYEYPVVDWHGGKVHKIRNNIFHLMRGEIYEIEGKSFFVMGGAYSTDRYRREEGVSWWPEELPNDDEYKNATANLKKRDFKVDYIVTHTLPREVFLTYAKDLNLHKIENSEDQELTGFLEWIMYEAQFSGWYCGHWHIDKKLNDKFHILWTDVVAIL